MEEGFTCRDGELSVLLGRQTLNVPPGETVTVARGVIHRFFNATARPVRFRIEVSPGNRDFGDSLIILQGLANDGLTNRKSIPKQPAPMGLVAELGDIWSPFPLSLLNPVVRPFAARARKQGMLQELRRHYCPS
ncbi:hypothetical protein GCM10010841_21190 [Deinococcus aerophilus]|uniref:Cupin type-2 domain-containing protein n=1 Tax=Deinococcus aerophilus TaxID=522488 RepID=A0ABQ2GUH9_9DEIO|nr:hypothetical protein GCM10010841_21190 [Deinococcus aerophilus]